MKNRHIVACMPDSAAAQKIYHDAVKPIVSTPRLSAISFLDAPVAQEFSTTIRTWIYLSNAVVAILERDHKDNVLYEVGVAVGLGKPVVVLADDLDQVPSMLRASNVVTFDPARPDLRSLQAQLASALRAALAGTFIDRRFRDHLDVLLSSSSPSDHGDGASPPKPAGGMEGTDLDHAEAGLEAYGERRYATAIAHLECALGTGSRDAHTYFVLADAHFFYGESLRPGDRQRSAYQRMQHLAKEGRRAYPTDRDPRKTHALASMKLGEFEHAERIFKELWEEDNEYLIAAYDLACLYCQQGKWRHCIDFLTEVFLRNPGFRFLARLDPDFDNGWRHELLQRLMYPAAVNHAI